MKLLINKKKTMIYGCFNSDKDINSFIRTNITKSKKNNEVDVIEFSHDEIWAISDSRFGDTTEEFLLVSSKSEVVSFLENYESKINEQDSEELFVVHKFCGEWNYLDNNSVDTTLHYHIFPFNYRHVFEKIKNN